MKLDVSSRFGFLISQVSKLYGDQFDMLAREKMGLSRAQCRLLSVLATAKDEAALSQIEIARRMDLSAMAVATLCDRMEASGWVRRVPSGSDRRVKNVQLCPKADVALDAAMRIGDSLTARVQASMTPDERARLISLLHKARDGLLLAGKAAEQAGKQ